MLSVIYGTIFKHYVQYIMRRFLLRHIQLFENLLKSVKCKKQKKKTFIKSELSKQILSKINRLRPSRQNTARGENAIASNATQAESS